MLTNLECLSGPARDGGAMTAVVLTRLAHDDGLLREVIQLWRSNSSTLGFFPEGAFEERARSGQILVATTPADGLVGYLAYRRTRERVAIIHLCVAPAHRGRSVARLLVDRLCEEVRECAGISLRCRRDYDASRAWPRLRFEAVNELPGRGRDGGTLTVWYRDLGNPDLFRQREKGQAAPGIRAAMDANVFFDLHDDAPQGVESRALLADWIGDAVDLYVTRELSNEVDRSDDAEARQRHRLSMTQFAKCDELVAGGFEKAHDRVCALLPAVKSENDASDRRHLAWGIAAGIEYFLTRDGAILDASEQLFSDLKILAVRPADFVRRLDEYEREEEYAPARLAGGSLKWRLVTSEDEERLSASLHSGVGGETRPEFLRRVRAIACEPRRFELRGVFDEEHALALVAFEPALDSVLRVPLFRLGRGTALVTLARHLLHEAQRRAVAARLDVVELFERMPCPELLSALGAEGWRAGTDGAWRKWTPRFMGSAVQLVQRLRGSPAFATDSARVIVTEVEGLLADCPTTTNAAAALERLLWPAKLLGAGLRTFLVPIKPGWAEHLVDERLAAQRLFGARDDLALNREAVYYRSPNRPAPSAPGRVLWYVTDDDSTQGTKAVRSCSALDEVLVGPGKAVFRQLRRFGVYAWRDVKPLMDRSDNGDIMAMRFSSSEMLAQPVEVDALRAILEEQGRGLMTAGPMEIDDAVFAAVYAAGGLA